MQSSLEEWLRKSGPIRGIVEAPKSFRESPDRSARLAPCPRDHPLLLPHRTLKPARPPQLRRDPASLVAHAPPEENRQRPHRTRRSAEKRHKYQRENEGGPWYRDV